MAMIKVCNVSDVPKNGMKGFTVSGKKVFVSNVGGNYYCNDSTCTHRGGPLEQGDLGGNLVTCPWHGAMFDVTSGKQAGGPAPAPVKNYKIEVRGAEVWADL